jgi:hypothetical protein
MYRISLLILLLIFSCNSKPNSNKQDPATAGYPESNNRKKEQALTEEDAILKTDNVIKPGGSSPTVSNAKNEILIKFRPRIQFSDFHVTVTKTNSRAPIQYAGNSTAQLFATVIANTYVKDGVNFAGHYCLVQWGCGSPCQTCALVDTETGLVYNGVTASLGYEFKKDSKMLLVNPPDSAGYSLTCAYCEPSIFVWNEKMKKFERR